MKRDIVKKTIFSLTALLALLVLVPESTEGATTSKTFYASDDASLVSDHPWDEYGNDPQIAISNSVSTGKMVKLVIRFDLASLPQDAVIKTASMNLYSAYCSGATDLLTVARLASEWSESTINWNTTLAYTPDRNYLLNDPACSTSGRWLNFYIDDIAKAWASGEPNNGVIIKPTDTENVNYLFASTESPESWQRPQLVLSYDYSEPSQSTQPDGQTSNSATGATTPSEPGGGSSASGSSGSGSTNDQSISTVAADNSLNPNIYEASSNGSDADILKEISEGFANKTNLKNTRLLIIAESAIVLAIILTILAYINRTKFKLKGDK